MKLTYRLPCTVDESIIKEYINEHYACQEYHLSASMNLTDMDVREWIKQIQRNSKLPNGEWGRSDTLLCLDGTRLIGLLNIRYELTDELRNQYGDIGYGVRPKERHKGYATSMLRHGLTICREKNMKEVIAGCYKDNIASAKTILNNRGQLYRECEDAGTGRVNQYYRIQL